MAYRVEIARNAEAELEELYLWVTARAPQQGAVYLIIDDRPKVVHVVHVRRGARRPATADELKGER
jgi:hypothetical protein